MNKIINVAETPDESWNFIEKFYPANVNATKNKLEVIWKYYSGSNRNIIEKFISRPKISRYRACIQATLNATNKNDLVISHLPLISHWQSVFMNFLGRQNKHMAFAFNFTDLPQGYMHTAMIKSFQRINHFVVYSEFERKQYAKYFNIPIKKIHMLHWAMEKPQTDITFTPSNKEYYCSVGGEGRDYQTLIDTFKHLPQFNLIIVTRPNTLDHIDIPSNVSVFYNLSSKKFWRIVEKSKAVIVPLIDENTACGHITLVGAMKLGKAIITSFSQGTTDYIQHNYNGLVVPPNDEDALQAAVKKLDSNTDLSAKFSQNNLVFTEKYCSPKIWVDFIQQFIERSLPS
jgi:glycosyltransferase involved in cell wall biosynthesis